MVQAWVPRLMPALRTALFHGAIRTAHAVRAIDAVDTAPRRGELARALGYWAAARYRAGQPAGPHGPAEDARAAVVRAAAGFQVGRVKADIDPDDDRVVRSGSQGDEVSRQARAAWERGERDLGRLRALARSGQ